MLPKRVEEWKSKHKSETSLSLFFFRFQSIIQWVGKIEG